MATGVHTDFVIRDAEFEAGFIEGVGQNTRVFNEASGGAIVLQQNPQRGYYGKRRFFDTLSSIISRRDLTSTSSGTGIKPTQDEVISVKLFRSAGPVDYTEGMFRTMAGTDIGEFSFELGQQVGAYAMKDYVNGAIKAGASFLSGETALVNTDTASGLDFDALNTGLGKMGDARPSIAALVMHSDKLTNLVADGLANYKVENVAGFMVISGAPTVAMGKPIIVTDDASLVITDGVTSGEDAYVTLGLVQGGIVVTESEELSVVQYLLDRAQITRRFHGEHAFNVEVKGAKWDTANGGANPNDTALALASNWDAVVADKRDKAGVYIKTS